MISKFDDELEHCVGRGAAVPRVDGPIHRYMTSAPGCWAMFGKLNAYIQSDPRVDPVRQLYVDAYAVQHPGSPNPQAIQSVAVHLISQYAQLEVRLPARAAHAVMNSVLKLKGQYRWLEPPSSAGARTGGNVLARLDTLPIAAREWAAHVWRAWIQHHAQIQEWYERAAAK